MKVLDHHLEINEETFAPEQIITISIPMTLTNEAAGESGQYTQEQTDSIMGKKLREAMEEYNRGIK